MKLWLSSLFHRSVQPPVSEPVPPSPEALQALELSEADWVRARMEQVPINRLITIQGVPVQLKMDIAKQGISNAWELERDFKVVKIPPELRPRLEAWLDEQRRGFTKRYQTYKAQE